MSFVKEIKGVRRVPTLVNDTPQKIALRELGDASRWYDIVQLNNLLPPYITSDLAQATDRVLFAGATILIPAPAPAPTGVAAADVYGTDVALQNGQIVDDGSGDLLAVSGLPNLQAALEHRLETHPGELLYHPDYGCQVYTVLGRGASQSAVQLAASFVARAVRSDPRVASVSKATATVVGDAIQTSATAVTVDGKTQPVGAVSRVSG